MCCMSSALAGPPKAASSCPASEATPGSARVLVACGSAVMSTSGRLASQPSRHVVAETPGAPSGGLGLRDVSHGALRDVGSCGTSGGASEMSVRSVLARLVRSVLTELLVRCVDTGETAFASPFGAFRFSGGFFCRRSTRAPFSFAAF